MNTWNVCFENLWMRFCWNECYIKVRHHLISSSQLNSYNKRPGNKQNVGNFLHLSTIVNISIEYTMSLSTFYKCINCIDVSMYTRNHHLYLVIKINWIIYLEYCICVLIVTNLYMLALFGLILTVYPHDCCYFRVNS